MEMVMSSSSDASAQRCRARVGRRRGVLRGLAGAALRAGAVRRVACRLPDWVLAAAGSSVVRAAVFYTVVMSLRINEVTGRAEKV